MKLILTSLQKSIEVLERSMHIYLSPEQMNQFTPDVQETIKAGVIQGFEIAYEQAWKMMKRWLENNVGSVQVDGVTRRELFRLAAEHQLIEQVEDWMDFHQARNSTSHIYDGEIAYEVLEAAELFLIEVKKLLVSLHAHHD